MRFATSTAVVVAALNALVFAPSPASAAAALPALSQRQEQLLRDRLYQTNLRGPRWTGNENQNTLTSLVKDSMQIAGLTVETLNYTFTRWDPRWWSLSLTFKNGTTLGLPTTGYWPYSGDSGLQGVTGPLFDVGTYSIVDADQSGNTSSLDFSKVPAKGAAIGFFDNPSPTRSYLAPGYSLLGTSRNIPTSDIPEIGNLSNPHWQSAKTLDFTAIKKLGVAAMISSWVHTSDANAALQYLPNDSGTSDDDDDDPVVFDVPTLYVGNATGEAIRGWVGRGEVSSATVVLDAPSVASAKSQTVIGHLAGTDGGKTSVLLYTHSDGPSIIEENGPILLLAIAEYFAQNKPRINLDFVITTGHMSGGRLDESLWMDSRPNIRKTAVAAIVCEHFGALEWKDEFTPAGSVYKPTGNLEPMWTMANDSSLSSDLRQLYLDAFEGTPDSLRMAMLWPETVNGVRSKWYGAGGSSTMGRSKLPTIGIIPQPDYLWAAMTDGGWSKLDIDTAIVQLNVVLRLISSLDGKYAAAGK